MAHCTGSILQVLFIVITITIHVNIMARSFVIWRTQEKTNWNMITFTVIDNKTRLDFSILLILCPYPDQTHPI